MTKGRVKRQGYLSYLLRMWQESEERPVWRASLQSPQSGERLGFASLDILFDFLLGQTRAAPDLDESRGVGQERGGARENNSGGDS
jgi:hypothetical protein